MKFSLLLFYLVFPTSLLGQSLFENVFRDEQKEALLEDSIRVLLNDIYYAIDLIDTLEYQRNYYKALYEEELRNIKIETLTEEVVVTRTVRDTVRITQTGFDTDAEFSIPFSITNYLNGSAYSLKGETNFKWDYLNNQPILYQTNIVDFRLNLNVSTTLIKQDDRYILETQPTTTQILITDNIGNVLTTDDYIQRVPSRLGIGFIGGYGFSYQGVTPYAGIGVTFNLFELSTLFRR